METGSGKSLARCNGAPCRSGKCHSITTLLPHQNDQVIITFHTAANCGCGFLSGGGQDSESREYDKDQNHSYGLQEMDYILR